MSDELDRETLVGCWLQKAERAVACAARKLADGDPAFAVNRCYYARFYEFTVVRDGELPTKYTAVRSFHAAGQQELGTRKGGSLVRGILRRTERAMSADEAWELLRQAPVGHLGTAGPDGWPYVVPVFFVVVDGAIYLHSACSGHKLDNLRADPRACFEVEELVGVVRPPNSACQASAHYRSVVVFGTARPVEAPEERAVALRELVSKYLPGYPGDTAGIGGGPGSVDDEAEDCCVIRIDPEVVTGKAHLPGR